MEEVSQEDSESDARGKGVSESDDILYGESPRFYASYLAIAHNNTPPDIDTESVRLLRDRGFTQYLIEHEDPVISVKMLAYVMSHTILKPQRLLVDNDDYYVAVDLFTNTYYICYRDLLMIDVDRYKGDTNLDSLKEELAKLPDLFFRIYSTRNGYHVFLLNRSVEYKSDENIRLMSQLGCDFYYIVYSYLRGWCVRLNKKKGEEAVDNLYTWVGDVVRGHFFPAQSQSPVEESDEVTADHTLPEHLCSSTCSTTTDAGGCLACSSIMPDPRLEVLVQLHINLVEVFKNVGLCSMPAP